MMTVETLVSCLEAEDEREPLTGTGFRDLDELVGGLAPGQVWLIASGPGQGKTTLAVQWAMALAGHDHPVQLVSAREPARWLAARMVSVFGRLPLNQVSRGRVSNDLQVRFADTRTAVASLPITVFPQADHTFTPEMDPYETTIRPSAVVVDDADLVSGVTPAMASTWADTGMLVILTFPREKILLGNDDEAPLDPSWARVCDVVLEVRHRGLLPREGRPGEADLVVHHHRWGPTRDLAVGFQGHYSRFVDIRT